MNKYKMLSLLVLLGFCMALFTGCGYRLSGFSNQIPPEIRTIAIPDFQNKTTRFQADQFITFAVKEEFIKRSKLRIVDRVDQADSVLEGTISSFTVVPISYSEDSMANLYRITISANVRFINLQNNQVIFEESDINFTDSYSLENASQFQDDFFSQQTDTLQKIAEKFAASVVTTIMENF